MSKEEQLTYLVVQRSFSMDYEDIDRVGRMSPPSRLDEILREE